MFHALILVDEINRAPPKVQSDLLVAMGERQVTAGGISYPLPDPFMVVATRNPIEHEGTYPLPEAQPGRFLLHVVVPLPDSAAELEILDLVEEETTAQPACGDASAAARGHPSGSSRDHEHLPLSCLEDDIVRLVVATRDGRSGRRPDRGPQQRA